MITTTISLFCNNSVIASSTIKCNPADLIRCYANIMDGFDVHDISIEVKPDIDYVLSKGIFIEDTKYTIMGGFDAKWLAMDDWSGEEDDDINKVVDWVIENINSTFRALA